MDELEVEQPAMEDGRELLGWSLGAASGNRLVLGLKYASTPGGVRDNHLHVLMEAEAALYLVEELQRHIQRTLVRPSNFAARQ
jgi:hypothetical protein